MHIPEDILDAAGPPTEQRALWRKHVLLGLAAAGLIMVIALTLVNNGAGAAPQLTRFGDWGYTAQSPSTVSYVTMNVYNAATNSRISSRRENINPYCAYGDPNSNLAPCYTPSLADGNYRIEAIAVGKDGSTATLSHTITVGDPPPSTSSGSTSTSGNTSTTTTTAGTTQMTRLGDWGYVAADSSKVSYVTMSVYDSGDDRISNRRENLTPYCAFGDGGVGSSSCNTLNLSSGTYRVEAVVDFTNGTKATLQHQVTVGSTTTTTTTTTSSEPAVAPTPVVTSSPGLLPANGVSIKVGDSWQAIVNANPTGTAFVVKAGTHRRQEVQPQSGQSFICESRRACVMDGEFVSGYAFRGSGSNVRISGMVMTRYKTPNQRGVIDNCLGGSGSGWVIEDNEITWNAAAGIYLGTSSRAVNNKVTYQGQLGLKACGSNGLYEGNEVAYNNSFCPTGTAISNPGGVMGCTNYGWEGGGSKFTVTNGLMIRNNHVYGNCGPGLWADINNINITWQGNNVHNNSGSGIFHEIGYKGWIKGNDVRNNGLTITVTHPTNGSSRTCQGGGGSWGGAEITVNNSSDTEVTDNYVDAASGRKGLMVVQQNRGSYLATGNWFHDNKGPDGNCTWAFSDYLASQFFASNNFGTRC